MTIFAKNWRSENLKPLILLDSWLNWRSDPLLYIIYIITSISYFLISGNLNRRVIVSFVSFLGFMRVSEFPFRQEFVSFVSFTSGIEVLRQDLRQDRLSDNKRIIVGFDSWVAARSEWLGNIPISRAHPVQENARKFDMGVVFLDVCLKVFRFLCTFVLVLRQLCCRTWSDTLTVWRSAVLEVIL